MSIPIHDNIKLEANKLLDERSMRPDGNYYTTKADVIEKLPLHRRAIGLIVFINGDIHYFKTGVMSESDIYPIGGSSYANQLTSIGEITVDGNDVTTPEATWYIENIGYSTTTPTTTNHPYSSAGTTRIDILVANTSNQIVKVSGTDTSGIAIRPNIPVNTVLVTQINVGEDSLTAIPFPLTSDHISAIQNANNPSASNPFLTVNDAIGGTSSLFLGDFPTLEALIIAHPTPVAGNTANIIVEFGNNDLAVWDNDDSSWVVYLGAGYGFTTPDLQQVSTQGAVTDKDITLNTLLQPTQPSVELPPSGLVRYVTQGDRVVFIWSDGSKAEFWRNGQFGNGTINLGLPRISGQATVKKNPYPISTGDYTIVNEDTDRVIICNMSNNLIFTSTSLSIGRDFDIYVPSSAYGTVTLSYTGATVAGFSSSPITLEKGYSYKLTRLSTYYQLIRQPEASLTFATTSDLSTKADLIGGLIPSSQLPAYVDDILEYPDLASFPPTGETGKIYIAISPKNLQYRWSGSAYIQVTNGFIASTDDVSEGSSNLYFTDARAILALASSLALKDDFAVSNTGTVITFDKKRRFDTSTSPATGNITNDLTGAKMGVVQKIYHNNSSAPTYPAGWVCIGGTYTNSVLNIIFAEWVEGSRVEYWIVKG